MEDIKLRPYQTEALDAIFNAEKEGTSRILVCLPTGTGKTRLFNELVRQRNQSSLIIAHTDELITQAKDKLLEVWPDVDYGIVKATRNEIDHQVVIGSKQTLQYQSRLDRIPKDKFELIITDEAHHAPADGYHRIYKHFGVSKGGNVLHLGVTATPNRTDKVEMKGTFDDVVYNKSLLEMIEQGWLCDLTCKQVQTEIDITDAYRYHSKDYKADELASLLDTQNCNELIVRSFQKHARGRITLAFCSSVGHAISLAGQFSKAGVKARAVYHKMGDDMRKLVLKQYAEGELQLLTNFNILTEGYDSPRTDCILIARPTSSNLLYTQMIGRGTRTHPEKKDCLILDVACITDKKNILELPTLFGLEKPPEEGEGISHAVSRLRRLPKADPEAIGGDIKSRDVDIFNRSRFAWVKIKDGYALGLGSEGSLFLKTEGLKYRIKLEKKNEEDLELTSRPMSLEWAQGVAEDYARDIMEKNSEITKLVDKEAKWRSTPATEKQLKILSRSRRRIDPNITRGEASELISQMFAGNKATDKQIAALRRLRIPFDPSISKGQAGRLLADAAKGK